jgi:predicted type IV restriction endonuclease
MILNLVFFPKFQKRIIAKSSKVEGLTTINANDIKNQTYIPENKCQEMENNIDSYELSSADP